MAIEHHVFVFICVLIYFFISCLHPFGKALGTGVVGCDVAGQCSKTTVFVGPLACMASCFIGDALTVVSTKDLIADFGFGPRSGIPNAGDACDFTCFWFNREIAVSIICQCLIIVANQRQASPLCGI